MTTPDRSVVRATSVVHDADLPWAPVIDGIELRVHRVGVHDNTYEMSTRIQPGIELPKHKHFGPVHLYTLSGTWGYREYDWLATSGTYVYEAPGTVHTYFVPDDAVEPAVNFVVQGAGMLLLEEEGVNPIFGAEASFQDGASTLELYRLSLEAAGIDFPADQVLQD